MSSELSAEKIVELFERDVRARERLAEPLVSEPDIRLVIINAVLRDVSTKSDLEKLRSEIHTEINNLRSEINSLRSEVRGEIDSLRREIKDIVDKLNSLSERVAKLESRVDLLIKVFLGFNVPLLIAVIGILLKLIFM